MCIQRGKGAASARKRMLTQFVAQNDAVNHPMIALNRKLGFTEEGANLRFVKKVG